VAQVACAVGHLVEAAVDALAKNMSDDVVPVPSAWSRHVSLRFYAKRSERDLALTSASIGIARRLPCSAGLRVTCQHTDALRAVRLCERDQIVIRMMRDDHARLQASRAYPDQGPHSLGAYLRRALRALTLPRVECQRVRPTWRKRHCA
jgi:hypothetical protein